MASVADIRWRNRPARYIALDPFSADIRHERRLLMDVRQQLGCCPDAEPRVLALVRGNGSLGLYFIPDPGVLVMDGRLRARFGISGHECGQSPSAMPDTFLRGSHRGAALFRSFPRQIVW